TALEFLRYFKHRYSNENSDAIEFLPRLIRLRLVLTRFMSLFLRRIDICSTLPNKVNVPQPSAVRYRINAEERAARYLLGRGLSHPFPVPTNTSPSKSTVEAYKRLTSAPPPTVLQSESIKSAIEHHIF